MDVYNQLSEISHEKLTLLIVRCARILQSIFISRLSSRDEIGKMKDFLKDLERILHFVEQTIRNVDKIDRGDINRYNECIALSNMAAKLEVNLASTAVSIAFDAFDAASEDTPYEEVLEFARRAVNCVIDCDIKMKSNLERDIEKLRQYNRIHLADLEPIWPAIDSELLEQDLCENYKYDVALSYASQDRDYVENFAKVLQDANLRVFYDKTDQEALKEANFYSLLEQVYGSWSRYIIIFYSWYYIDKHWPVFEMQSSIKDAVISHKDKIIILNLDNRPLIPVYGMVKDFHPGKINPEKFAYQFIQYINQQ